MALLGLTRLFFVRDLIQRALASQRYILNDAAVFDDDPFDLAALDDSPPPLPPPPFI